MLVSKQIKNILKTMMAIVIACLVLLSFTGCSEQNQEPENTIRIFGIESENALGMNFVNGTDQEIIDVSVKAVGIPNAEFGDNIIGEDDPWAADEVVTLFCDSYGVITEENSAAGEAAIDIELLPTYDIRLSFADGTSGILHDVTFTEAEEVAVHVDSTSGLCYLTYELNGSEASSLESELAIQAAEVQAAEAAAAAEQNAEYVDESYVYDYGYTESNYEPAGGAVNQTQDACISQDDLLFNE